MHSLKVVTSKFLRWLKEENYRCIVRKIRILIIWASYVRNIMEKDFGQTSGTPNFLNDIRSVAAAFSSFRICESRDYS
jgi:hypothetical protein